MANGTRTLALQIPEELFVRIKEHLSKYGLTQKEFIIGLIESCAHRRCRCGSGRIKLHTSSKPSWETTAAILFRR